MEKKERFDILKKEALRHLSGVSTRSFKKALEDEINYDELISLCTSQTYKELYFCLKNDDSPFNHICPICGKLCDFNGLEYVGSCRENECLCKILLQNDDIKDKHQYIIDNYLNGDKRFNYIQLGFIEKYHVFSNSQLKGWHESVVNAYNSKTDEERKLRREKTIKTCREKYGTDFSQQNADIKNKQKKTWRSKTQQETDVATQRRKKTCLEKYGVDHIMKSEDIINEVKDRHLKENGYYHWIQKEVLHKDIYMDDEKFKDYIKKLYAENGNKPVKKTDLDDFFNINVSNRCHQLKLMKFIEVRRSPLEEMLKKVFDENQIRYEWRNRSIIDGPHGKSHCYELDFYLPDYKIGIEVNDLSTHSINAVRERTAVCGDRNYHLYKTQNCKEKGIRLIHIWEWELKKNFEKTSNWILNELNKEKRKIYARQCELKNVSLEEEKTFLNAYHLQGYSKSEICLGLYFDNELIQLMSFTKARYDKKYQYELLRLCSNNGFAVIGGAERLFKNFIKQNDPESIISYCDFSKFSGKSYEKIGMKFDKLSKPTAYYCNFDMNVINESMLMKYGVDNLLHTNYGKGADNRELMIKHGYLPVYNCGNLIFTWHK